MKYLIVQYHTAGDRLAHYITGYSENINWEEDPDHFFIDDTNAEDGILFMCAADRLISVSVINEADLVKWMVLNDAYSLYNVFTPNEIRADFGLPPQLDPMTQEVHYAKTGNA